MKGAAQLDADFAKLVYRLRTPLYWVKRRRYVPRVEPAELVDRAGTSIEIERDPAKAFNQALEFRASGFNGLYAVALMQAGINGHPTACVILAGLLVQRAITLNCINRRTLFARAIGWLSFAQAKQFESLFGGMEQMLREISDASAERNNGGITETRRALERSEGKVTVVRREVIKPALKLLGEERYQRLNSPFDLKGDITAASKQAIVDVIRREYPWADELIAEIDCYMTFGVATNQPQLKLPPMLIVGPPGVGKTRFARRLSELTSVPYTLVSAAGASDNRDFAGTSRGWSSVHPSRITEILIDTDCANPIVVIDEVDKFVTGSRNGNILQTLLTMLAPETNARYRDEGLNVELDLSHVNWILTANNTRNLDWPLLTRLKTVALPLPAAGHAEGIVDLILTSAISKLNTVFHTENILEPEIRGALLRAARLGATPRTLTTMVEKSIAIKMQWEKKRIH